MHISILSLPITKKVVYIMQTLADNALIVNNVDRFEAALNPLVSLLNEKRNDADFKDRFFEFNFHRANISYIMLISGKLSDKRVKTEKKLRIFENETLMNFIYYGDRTFEKMPREWSFSTLEWLEIAVALSPGVVKVAGLREHSVELEVSTRWKDCLFLHVLPLFADIVSNREDFMSIVREVNDLGGVTIIADDEKVKNSDFYKNRCTRDEDVDSGLVEPRNRNRAYNYAADEVVTNTIKHNYTPEIPLSLFFDVFFDNAIFSKDKREHFELKEKTEMLTVFREEFSKGVQ